MSVCNHKSRSMPSEARGGVLTAQPLPCPSEAPRSQAKAGGRWLATAIGLLATLPERPAMAGRQNNRINAPWRRFDTPALTQPLAQGPRGLRSQAKGKRRLPPRPRMRPRMMAQKKPPLFGGGLLNPFRGFDDYSSNSHPC